jgi:plasmid stabilization system protein ParE
MAEVVWTEPALADLDAIADYMALDNTQAARELVQRVFRHVGQLVTHPLSGPGIGGIFFKARDPKASGHLRTPA